MRLFWSSLLIAGMACLTVSSVQADGRASPYDRVTAEANGWIYDDFEAGISKAKETGKPLLVVLRCPP